MKMTQLSSFEQLEFSLQTMMFLVLEMSISRVRSKRKRIRVLESILSSN
uniref:Uncharacterized protein n=1 Tax=Lepeophtheirus salmonis TaxID=72036 RepID=A0A0K2T3M9_LEPSM